MSVIISRYFSVFLITFSVLIVGGCVLTAKDSQSVSGTNSLLNEDALSGALPESFVSVGKLSKRGKFQHLVGGFLIHPGVILTSWHFALDYLEHSRGLDRKTFSEDLYVAFSLEGSSNKTLFKVMEVMHQSYVSSLRTDKYEALVMLLFQPSDLVSHVDPIKLATTEDIAYLKEAIGSEMWSVGIRGYRRGKKHPKKCPYKSHTRLGRVEFAFTPEEYELMHMAMMAFPGRLDSVFADEEYSGFTFFSIPASPWVTHHQFDCRRKGFCVETRPTSLTARFADSSYLQYSCNEHIGYPLLWRSPSGDLKALSLTISTLTSSFYSFYSNQSQAYDDNQGWWTDYPFKTTQYDLIHAHEWIRFTLKYHDSSADLKIDGTTPPLDTYIDTIRASRDKHPEFFVSLTTVRKHLSNHDVQVCRGTLIHKKVMITAAHCVLDLMFMDDAPYRVIVRAGQKDHILEIQSAIFHPTYKAIFKKYIDAYVPGENKIMLEEAPETMSAAVDLALLILEDSAVLESIDPIGLPDPASSALSENAEWITSTSFRGYFLQDVLARPPNLFRPYRWAKGKVIQGFKGFVHDRMEFLDGLSSVRRSEIFARAESLTQEKVVRDKIRGKLLDLVRERSEGYMLLSFGMSKGCSQSTSGFCLISQATHNRLERQTLVCKGGSGGPVIAEKQGRAFIYGVQVTVLTYHYLSSGGCSKILTAESVLHELDWIRAVISEEVAK